MSNDNINQHPIQGMPETDRSGLTSGGVPVDLMRTQSSRRGSGGFQSTGPNGNPRSEIESLIAAMFGAVNFNQQPFTFATTIIRLRPQEERAYLLIQNTDVALTMYVGFGLQPGTTTGLIILAGGYYEPLRVPQNEIFVLGTGTGSGILITGAKA